MRTVRFFATIVFLLIPPLVAVSGEVRTSFGVSVTVINPCSVSASPAGAVSATCAQAQPHVVLQETNTASYLGTAALPGQPAVRTVTIAF